MLRRVQSVPDRAVKVAATNGEYVLGFSETGHRHVVRASANVSYYNDDTLLSYLVVENEPVTLDHRRSHETLLVSTGTYEVRRQREHSITSDLQPARD